MLKSRPTILFLAAAALVGSWLAVEEAQAKDHYGPNGEKLPYTPVVTPNGSTLPWKMVEGVKEFHLIVEEIKCEFAPESCHAWRVLQMWHDSGTKRITRDVRLPNAS